MILHVMKLRNVVPFDSTQGDIIMIVILNEA